MLTYDRVFTRQDGLLRCFDCMIFLTSVSFFKLNLYYSFVFSFFLFSCNFQSKPENNYTNIEICLTKDKIQYLNASECISEIEYVALETAPQCLIGETHHIYISENYILAYSKTSCMLFSRQGKFIRNIGSYGMGPEEYDRAYNIEIDEKSGMIYLSSTIALIAYRISGEFVKKLNLVELANKHAIGRFQNIKHWKNDIFCSNIDISSGKEPYRFVVFRLDGDIIKLFPNYVTFDSNIFSSDYTSEADIYLYNEQLSFREFCSDTLFRLFDDLKLIPDLVFDLCGQKKPTNLLGLGVKASINQPNNYTAIQRMYEVRNFILFECSFGNINPADLPGLAPCLYDRKNNRLVFCKPDPLAKRDLLAYNDPKYPISESLLKQVKHANTLFPGFINDIDGGFPFWPYRNAQMQNDNQAVARYHPFELLDNLTEEYFAAHKIKDTEAHIRLKKLMDNMDEEDNPVLMIATFK